MINSLDFWNGGERYVSNIDAKGIMALFMANVRSDNGNDKIWHSQTVVALPERT